MSERPGFMVYLDILGSLEEYTHEELGMLFLAMCKYAKYGEVPQFNDKALRVIWNLIQPKIDYDNYRYKTMCLNNEYKTYKREAKKDDAEPLELVDWLVQRHPEISTDIHRYLFESAVISGYQLQLQLQLQPATTTPTATATNNHNIQPSLSNQDGKEIKGGVGEKEETRTIPGLDFPPLSPEEFAAKRDAAILSLRAMMKGVEM